MSRRRRSLAILMRARMRAARDTAAPADAHTRGAASGDDSHLGGGDCSGALSGGGDVEDAKALMRASICTGRRSLVADVNERSLRDFIKVCLEMTREDRQELLLVLAEEYNVDRGRVRYLMQQYVALDLPSSGDGSGRSLLDGMEDGPALSVFYRLERNMMEALRPKYVTFIEQLNALPGGLKLLVDLRADLLLLLMEHNTASVRALDFLLKEKLVTCLSPATLELKQITWNDSASLLEKIVAYEAVHPIRNLLDLKRRLSPGRRCFGYLHPAIPEIARTSPNWSEKSIAHPILSQTFKKRGKQKTSDYNPHRPPPLPQKTGEPLIFIEVALLKDIAQSIQEVLWESPPIPEREAACALFYSISSTQIFATLSPVPGYMQWLQAKLVCHSKLSECELGNQLDDKSNSTLMENILTADEEREIMNSCPSHISGRNGMEVMQKLLALPANEWTKNDQVLAVLQPSLLRLCARYLLDEKKRGKALDVVANFHLQNGAMIERINWMADRSEEGLQQSGGIMVNYVYRLDEIEKNAHAYSVSGDIRVSHNLIY